MSLKKKSELKPTTIRVYRFDLRKLVAELDAIESGRIVKSDEYVDWLKKRIPRLERQLGIKAGAK